MTDTRTDAERCGVIRKCGRPIGHRGHCGGWRKLDALATPRGTLTPPTDRELEVIAAAAKLGCRPAAQDLGISYQTAKNHLTNLYRKLDAQSMTDALLRMGWLQIPESA